MIAYRTILTMCFALFLSACATTPVLTSKSADMSREIKQKAPIVSGVDISLDGRYALSGSFVSSFLWDIQQGKKLETFMHKGFLSPVSVAFSPDGKYFASGGKGTKLWDLTTGEEIRTFDEEQAESVVFSPDGKHLLSGGPNLNFNPFVKDKEARMKIYDVATGEQIKDFSLKIPQGFYSVAYSPDGRRILSGDSAGEMKLWNTSDGKPIKTVKASGGFVKAFVRSVAFSADGKYAVSGGSDNRVILWNATDLTPIKTFVSPDSSTGLLSGILSVAFSPDGKYVLSGRLDGKINIWDIASGSEWKNLIGHATWAYGTSAKYFPNGKYVISAGDASTRIWDVSTGEEVATMIAFKDGEWIVTTASGYYNSSPKGDQYLQVKVGDKDYSIEQLREGFYRPDTVRLALSGGSLKDLRKLADVKQPPAVAIVDTPASVAKDEAAVTLRLTDSGGGIGDIRLFLNGTAVMLDNGRGITIAPKSGTAIQKTYTLKLVNGMNSIRAVAFNSDNTMQSNDALFQITAAFRAATKPSINALIVGINDYKNPKLQLKYAVPDADLFEKTLRSVAVGLFEKATIKKLITAEETTSENIAKELKAFQKLNPDDIFVFFVASHGIVDDGEYFLITSNVGSTRTEKLRTDALSQTSIKELIANIPATKKLIVLDTCNAGALGDAIQTAMLTRGMSEDTAVKILSRAVGSTILSASTSVQEALEGYNGHGLFTYVLAEGLKGKADKGRTGYIKTTELADYVDNEVPALAERVFKKAQYPTISISGQGFPVGKVN